MVKIKLIRKGPRNKPFYSIVAINHKAKKTAPVLENLGYWQPSTKDFKADKTKIKEWVKKGAQISPTVKKLLSEK